MTIIKIVSAIICFIVFVIAISIIGGSFYVVDEGERAVILSNSKIISTSTPGIYWKKPFIDDAKIISIRTQTSDFKDVPVYTSDRQTATVTFSINYSALPGEVEQIYRNFGTLDSLASRMILRPAKEQIASVFGTFTADTAIRERTRLNTELTKAISNIGDGLIKIEAVQIENITFSKTVEEAAEQRAQAEMAVQTKKQELERTKVEAEITVTRAQALADSQLASAKSKAESIRIEGQASADAIKAKSEALHNNPDLIDLTKAERWNGALPSTMMSGNSVPFVSLK